MVFKRFKYNTRLWLLVSFALFVPPWFIWSFGKHNDMRPVQLWLLLFSSPLNLGELVAGIFVCTLLFGIPALAIGWVIHCLIIIVRDTVKKRRRNAGQDDPEQ